MIIFPQPTDEDDEGEGGEGEEVVLDEEAQLMASMGLPLAFASSSDHSRQVIPSRVLLVKCLEHLLMD